jgi:thymidylate kinase
MTDLLEHPAEDSADGSTDAVATAVEPSADWVTPFVAALVSRLDDAGVRWLVLRNHEDIPDRIGHDLDLIVHPHDSRRVDPLVRAVVARLGLALLRAYAGIEHETFDVAAADLRGRLVLHVDVQTAARHRGRTLVDADDLFAHRRRQGALWVPTPAMEGYALLLHAALHKGALKPKYAERVAACAAAEPGALIELARTRLGQDLGRSLAAVDTEADLLALRARLRRALARRYPANPARQAWFIVRSSARQARLRLRPRGVFAVFLGPDGSGKSSLTDLLAELLGGHEDVLPVRRVYLGSGEPLLPSRRLVRRLRGKTGPNAKQQPVRDVRPRRLRGALHVLTDQILRYWAHVRPRLGPHAIVLADRYAYDVLRVNNPVVARAWFQRLAVALVPTPHLGFFLEGDPAVVAARKQELTVEETVRQQQRYREVTRLLPNFRALDLTVRDDAALRRVAAEILRTYARRNRGAMPG